MSNDRIIFFSKDDASWYMNLSKVEKLCQKVTGNPPTQINDLLELYQVKQYFDAEKYLPEWTELEKKQYISMAENAMELCRTYFLSFDDTRFTSDIGEIVYNYRKSFWHLLQYFQAYQKLSGAAFLRTILDHMHHLQYILKHKNLVARFNNELRQIILADLENTELLLNPTIKPFHRQADQMFFPESLTNEDKENLIIAYLNAEDPNPNFVNLIVNIRDKDGPRLSAKTKLLARTKAAEIKKRITGNKTGVGIELVIQMVNDQEEPFRSEYKGLKLELFYGVPYLDSLKDPVRLVHCFKSLFGFIDDQNIIALISKESELQVIERVSTHSKNAYPTGFSFNFKIMQSRAQMMTFQAYLNKRNTSIEAVTASYINEFLNPVLGLTKLYVRFPETTLDPLSKIRILAPELENIFRQYQLFVTEGHINHDLLQVNSEELFLSKTGSLLAPKYFRAKGDQIRQLQYLFFSDQSSLYYFEEFQGKYGSFFELILQEDIMFDSLPQYKKEIIEWLITQGHLQVTENGAITVCDPNEIDLAGILFRDGILNFWRHDQTGRETITRMKEKGWLEEENNLLCRQEIDYYNFYLNNKSFTNGYNIRNKYLHGINNQTTREHENDYYTLLMLTVIALLKIEDELHSVKSKNRTNGQTQ